MARLVDKAPAAFRTITEVSNDIDVPPHVLRFWEGKFSQLRPMTRPGGRRFYRNEDVALLKGLRALLQDDGYTIKGVQKLLKEHGVGFARARGDGALLLAEGETIPPSAQAHGPIFTQLATVVSEHPELTEKLQRTLARLEKARTRVNAVLER